MSIAQAGQEKPCPSSQHQCANHAPARIRRGRPCGHESQLRECQQACQEGQRRQREEHGAPAEAFSNYAGKCGSNQSGHNPGGRKQGQHPGSRCLRIATPNTNVGNRTDGAAAQSLQGAPGNEHQHARGQPTDEQASGKQDDANGKREPGTTLIRNQPGDDDSHELCQQECGEGPTIKMETTQLFDHGWQHRGNRQRLKSDRGDGQHQAKRQQQVLLVERAGNPEVCHSRCCCPRLLVFRQVGAPR